MIYDAFRLVPGNTGDKGKAAVARIVTCVRGVGAMVSGGRRRGRSGKMRRRAGRRFLAITSEGKFTIIETTAACVNFACKCAYATPPRPPFFSPKPSSPPPFILLPPRFFFPLPTRSLLLLSSRANPSFPSPFLTEPRLPPGFSPLPLPLLALVVDPNDVRGGPREAELDK